MSEKADNSITLSVEGLESEGGHVRLDEFLKQLDNLLLTLNGIDRIVGETASPTLYYRVIKASHNSPLTFTFEPVVKPTVKLKIPRQEHIHSRHERFFTEIDAIRANKPVSPEIDESILEHLSGLASGLGSTFKAATISNGAARVEVDKVLEMGIRRLLNEDDVSYGTAEGTLDALNIHDTNRRFWIYPQLGPRRIRCDFLPGEKDRLREAVGNYVRVEGVKYFRANNPFPVRIAVREFKILTNDEGVSLIQIGGAAEKATHGIGAVEFVRTIRDEWD